MAALLQCLLSCTSGRVDGKTFAFCPDEKKKSVFWLGESGDYASTTTTAVTSSTTTTTSSSTDVGSKKDVVDATCDRPAAIPQLETGLFMNAPAECRISLLPSSSSSQHQLAWAIGGFQLMSNARQVEVYLTPATAEPNEIYIMTVKGLPVSQVTGNGNDQATSHKLYKALCAVPGGPRPVESVRLVFQNLGNGDKAGGGGDHDTNTHNAQLRLQWIKLTARVATPTKPSQPQRVPTQQQAQDDPQNAASMMMMMGMMQSSKDNLIASDSETTTTDPAVAAALRSNRWMQQQLAAVSSPLSADHYHSAPSTRNGSFFSSSPPPPPLRNNNDNPTGTTTADKNLATASDVGAAMAGLHFSLRSTEDRILKKMESNHQKLQEQLLQQQQRYLASLQQMFQQQQLWIEQRLREQQSQTNTGQSLESGKTQSTENFEEQESPSVDQPERSKQSLWRQYAQMDPK